MFGKSVNIVEWVVRTRTTAEVFREDTNQG